MEAAMTFGTPLLSLLLPLLRLLGSPEDLGGIEVRPTLVCDTQLQVERFVTLFDGDTQTAVAMVNAGEHNPTACGLATLAYVRGPTLATSKHKNVTFQIVEILVVGLFTSGGLRPVEPARFFSFLVLDRKEA